MVRLLAPLLAGNLLATSGVTPFPATLMYILLMALPVAYGLATIRRQTYTYRWAPGLLLNLALLTIGLWLPYLHDDRNGRSHFSGQSGDRLSFLVQAEETRSTAEKIKTQTTVLAAGASPDSLQPARGRLLLYLERAAGRPEPRSGDLLFIRQVRCNPAPPPLNPDAFDYARYLHWRNLHFQAYAGAQDWQLIQHQHPGYLTALPLALRQWCLAALETYVATPRERSVASALILGYKDDLTEEIRDAYAGTGAMHILAVSGLHVGMIYLAVRFLLGLFPLRSARWRLLSTLLQLAAVWSFALVTGASPSVQRAATMFSFFILGQLFHRHTNIYNTLAASAFFLILVDPFVTRSVGFQLSYLAVLGIVYFQPRLYRLWYIPMRAGDYCWQLTTVSIAAQLGTLPLTIYYFHQFPVYFWLSGLVVVPGAVLILSGGLLLFAFSCFPLVATAIGSILTLTIHTVNELIFHLHTWPGGLIDGLWIGQAALLLLYLTMIMGLIALETRRFRWVLTALIGLLALAGMRAYTHWQVHRQRSLVIYHHRNHTVIDLFAGRQRLTLQDTILPPDQLRYSCENHRLRRRAGVSRSLLLSDSLSGAAWGRYQAGMLHLGACRLAITDGSLPPALLARFDPQLILIRGAPDRTIAELIGPARPERIIWDASNTRRQSQRWRRECESAGYAYHDMHQAGAFLRDLKTEP